MTEEEAREYRTKIVQLLRASGFSWVVEEVQSEIADGKFFEKDIVEIAGPQVLHSEEFEESSSSKSRRDLTWLF